MASAGVNLLAAAVLLAVAASVSPPPPCHRRLRLHRLCPHRLHLEGGNGFHHQSRANRLLRRRREHNNLEEWGGLMGPGYNYFERGNLDIFSGRGPCLAAPPCWMELYSDGSGPHHGWYCNYVEVTTTGPHVACAQQLFTVEQWLATDAAPYELTASRDYCGQAARGGAEVKQAAVASTTLVN
ncbi:unnamed protein product [Spirodela intermedia]|uniref:PLAT domain-containing protein n=1 Tax=Spirodela intermedia TaxID=51605 RepID=A0A7I8J2X1_SPIIN|nr:unnamed protein product [Spirodela intermedia]CAA6664409.1 unnamed protein product [Spirodela intermedia]